MRSAHAPNTETAPTPSPHPSRVIPVHRSRGRIPSFGPPDSPSPALYLFPLSFSLSRRNLGHGAGFAPRKPYYGEGRRSPAGRSGSSARRLFCFSSSLFGPCYTRGFTTHTATAMLASSPLLPIRHTRSPLPSDNFFGMTLLVSRRQTHNSQGVHSRSGPGPN